jgi:hypothetical protein
MRKKTFLLCTALSLWGWQSTAQEQLQNTSCATAEAITLSTPISTPQGSYRWYKLTAAAGKGYGVAGEGISGTFFVYPSCDGAHITGGSGTFAFTAAATQDYYIRVNAYDEVNSWSVSEVTDNRVCAYAEAITLSTPVSTPQGGYRWYKLAAAAGKSYGVAGGGINGDFYVYSACNGDQIAYSSGTFVFTATAAQDYYIRVNAYNETNSWSVSEVTDNRVCAYAEQVTLNAKIPVSHANFRELWYRTNVQAGKWYGVSVDNDNSDVAMYIGCGGSNIASGYGSGTTYFRASGNAAVNIRHRNDNANETDTLIIREVAAADVPNTTCATAKSITAGQQVSLALIAPYENYYYKLAVEIGKVYQIPQNIAIPGNIYYEITTGCGDGSSSVASGYLQNGRTFVAQSASEYIIRVRANENLSPGDGPLSWQVNESDVTYPISCAIAKPVSINTSIQTQTAPSSNSNYYYKFTPAPGQAYQITWESEGSTDGWVYDGCGDGNTRLGRSYNDTLTFIAPSSGDCYIEWESSSNFSWRISEFMPPAAANAACATAEQVQLSNNEDDFHVISAFLMGGQERWYKFATTEGNYYNIEGDDGRMNFAVYTSCGGAPVANNPDDDNELTYRAAQTGTAYLKVTGTGARLFVVAEAAAGSGTICEAAIPVVLGDSVRNESNGRLWYSIAAAPGYLYTISNTTTSSGSNYLYISDGCGNGTNELAYGYSYSGNPITFSVSSAKTCYIDYDNYNGNPQTWVVSRVSVEDNAICSNAEPAQLGTLTTTTVDAVSPRWYHFSGTAGKMYEIDGNPTSSFGAELYYGSSCEELSVRSSRHAIVAGENKPVYFGWKASSGSGDVAWTITEIAADNRLCAYAENVSVGDTIQSTLKSGVIRWYKFTAQAGKTYEIFGSNSSGSSVEVDLLSGTCDDFKEVVHEYTNGNISLFFQPTQNGVYYIEYMSSAASDYVLSWQVHEVTENVICAKAAPVTANVRTGNTHTGGKPLWYAFTAPTAGQYSITAPSGQVLKVRESCGGSPITAASSGSATFTVAAGATYYIEWIAAGSYEYSYQWSISKYEPAALTALSVFGYSLSPTFAPYTESYRVNVPYSETSVTIIAEAPSGATVTGDGVKSSLSVGETPFTVTVAANGSSKSYTITVYRAPENASNNATLSALTVSAGVLTPAFSPAESSYAVSVGSAVSSITIAATAASGFVSDTGTYSLTVGSGNRFLITVVAEDGVTERVYSIVVTRAAPQVVSVTVSPGAVSVPKGGTQQFSSIVTVTGNAAQTVTWSVEGNSSTSTTISATGLLTVAADETAATLTVRATSTVDNTKSGTATVSAEVSAETGVESQLTAAVKLYPNPFAGVLHLSGAEGCTLRVISSGGATVYIRLLTSSDEAVHLENLPTGLYFIRLEKDGKSKTLQAVKL